MSGPIPVTVLLVFSTEQAAAREILAVPALARALREVGEAGHQACYVHIPDCAKPSASCTYAMEIERLAPGLTVTYCVDLPAGTDLIVQGEALLMAGQLTAHRASEFSFTMADNRMKKC